MKVKRGVALILACGMLFAMLEGCSKNEEAVKNVTVNKTGYPVVDEKITLKAMGATNSMLPDDWNDLLLFRELEKITNMHLEFIMVDDKSYEERKNIAFASDDLPDFFFKGNLTAQDEMAYGSQGMLIDLKPYLDYVPNVKKVFEEYPEVEPGITTDDGKIYTLPTVGDIPRDRAEKLWINKKWLDKLGMNVPTTMDELYEVLKAFKTQDPNGNGIDDEIPMTFWDPSQIKQVLSCVGLMYNYFVDDSGKVIYAPITEQHKAGLEFMHKLYAEGMIDQNSFTQTSEKVSAKGNGPDEVLGAFVSMGAILQVGEERHPDYVLVPPLKTEDGKQVWPGRDRFSRGTFAITKNNKYPEATMRYIDYLYSEEGGRLFRAGIEGETYKLYEDGTWELLVPEGMSKSDFECTIGTNAGVASPVRQPSEFILNEREDNPVNAIINSEMEKLTPFLKVPYPQVYFSNEDQKKITTLTVDLNSAVDQFLARVITGDIDLEKEWDGYVQNLKNIGVDELVDIYQKAYDKYISK